MMEPDSVENVNSGTCNEEDIESEFILCLEEVSKVKKEYPDKIPHAHLKSMDELFPPSSMDGLALIEHYISHDLFYYEDLGNMNKNRTMYPRKIQDRFKKMRNVVFKFIEELKEVEVLFNENDYGSKCQKLMELAKLKEDDRLVSKCTIK